MSIPVILSMPQRHPSYPESRPPSAEPRAKIGFNTNNTTKHTATPSHNLNVALIITQQAHCSRPKEVISDKVWLKFLHLVDAITLTTALLSACFRVKRITMSASNFSPLPT
jgi:hypothetical protein